MRIARVRFDGRTATAIISGRSAQLVRGGPFGRLQRIGELVPLSKLQFLPPVRPTKIVAIGINYYSHAGERTPPAQPEPFLKAPSSLIGHGQTILLPRDAGRVDEEAEVVAVIGRRASRIAEADVDRYVFGYTCGNDVSAREWQRDDLQWWRAKSSDTFTAVGPWIETTLTPEHIGVEGRVNGVVIQHADTSQMVHSIRKCIARITSVMTLERGDLVFTGTPGTTAALHPGDVVEVEVVGVGVLRNPVALAP
ncbi:MAG: FAA hydrolase family protein [Dehalococcoidia bacterium]|nr:FAA hydrolase family protein [Dehalococcoidia bacterium]